MKKTLAMLLVLALLPACAIAASPWTEADSYTDQITQKLDFGIKNLLTGWTEALTTPYEAKQADECVTKGFVEGVYNGLIYTVGGALHTATFFAPVDIPIKDNGVQYE